MFSEMQSILFDEIKIVKPKMQESEQKFIQATKEYKKIIDENNKKLDETDDKIEKLENMKINYKEVLSEESVSIPYLLALLTAVVVGITTLFVDKSFLYELSKISYYYLNFGCTIFATTGSIGLVSFGKNIYDNIKNKKNNNKNEILKLKEIKNDLLTNSLDSEKVIELEKNCDIAYKEFMDLANRYEEILKKLNFSNNDNVMENEEEIYKPKLKVLKDK